MTGGLEVADVFRDGESQFREQYGHMLSREQRKVLKAITRCRTAALGGHVQECDLCHHRRIQYHSCRNRHCPKCQATARAKWMEARCQELLPAPYFHVVFTLPPQLAAIALQNKRLVYNILFQAAGETLKEVAANPKYLGATVGVLAVLHTWGQNLMHHPHVHCVVTGGGISPDRSSWIPCKRSRRRRKLYFLPVKVLSPVFRGKFIELLKRAFYDGRLEFHGKLAHLAQASAFEHELNVSVRKKWVVYAKPPFGGPEQVLKYLARYTHRVAISSQRLIDLRDGQVRFRYKDYADQQQTKVLPLTSAEFIRRFLLHTLPSGFVRIRYYGFLANRYRAENLEHCRTVLGMNSGTVAVTDQTAESTASGDPPAHETCPACGRGRLFIIDTIPAPQLLRGPHFAVGKPATPPILHGSTRAPPVT